MDNLKLYYGQKEKARSLFIQTLDKSHLKDMFEFDQKIKQEKLDQDPRYKAGRALEYFAITMLILVITSPFITYVLR